MIPTMLFVVILVFTINYFSEGDPVSDILGPAYYPILSHLDFSS